MTHFNHEWDTTKTPAVPVSTGDRYYAQDLNDDFNYLKHLPYEVFLQRRSRGVMVAPNDVWDNNTNILTLSGGFGVISQDCIELDPNEGFTIPPKTHSSPRYERIPFVDTALVLPPEENKTYYIVATPTKRSLLQRTKALFTEQYASRVRYDGVITIQDTTPTAGQILIGLCCYKQCCLLIDNNPDQCRDNIILKKWFGQDEITQDFISALQSYYNTSVASIETKITISTVSGYGVDGGTFNNCTITIDTINNGGGSYGIHSGIFNDCTININTSDHIGIIGNSTFNNCTININTVSNTGIHSGTFNDCAININTVNSNFGVDGGTFNNCIITIGTVNNYGSGVNNGTFNSCTISIGTVSGYGIAGGATCNSCTISIGTVSSGCGIDESATFNSCTISIGTVSGGSIGITNVEEIDLNLTRIRCTAITSLGNTSGKLNILNGGVFHTS